MTVIPSALLLAAFVLFFYVFTSSPALNSPEASGPLGLSIEVYASLSAGVLT